MCNRVNIGDMNNSTLEEIYNFYFEPVNTSAYEESESKMLNNIVFMGVILGLISFTIILFVILRTLTREEEIPMYEAILMNRIQALRNEMNPEALRNPIDPNSDYQMRNNRTPKNTSAEGSTYHDIGFVNPGIEMYHIANGKDVR